MTSIHVRRRFLLGGVAALAAVAVLACTPKTEVTVQQPSTAAQTGIAVAGTGTVSVKPDVARLDLGVEATAATVAAARAAAADAMQKVQATLKQKGVADADVRTQSLSITPQYSFADRAAPKITGYNVRNTVQVTIRNLDTASDVLDAAVAAGGNAVRVNGITFTVDKPEQVLAQAREEAVKNARAHAEVLAKAAGVTLGAARSISESTGGFPIPLAERALAAPATGGGPTPISPGEQSLQVTVSVVYEITK